MSTRSYIWWSVGLGGGGALVAGTASYVACVYGATLPVMLAVMGLALAPFIAIGTVLGLRWQRDNGIPRQWPKPAIFLILAALFLIDGVAFVLEERIFSVTGSRASEGVLALAFATPASVAAVLVCWRLVRAPLAAEYSMLRFNFWIQILVFFVFSANQVLTIGFPQRHEDPDLRWLQEANIAGRFILIFSLPAFIYARWARLRNTASRVPPFAA